MTASTLTAGSEAAHPPVDTEPGTASRPPADQAARDRFIGELGRNFSVIAPAGVGKTRSIVERIAAITVAPGAAEVLPYLLVVTYTDRAAREMKRRARQRVLQMQQAALQADADDAAGNGGVNALSPSISAATMAAFNQAFFGTIHSLCVRLLQTHGHFLGVPARFEVADEDRLDELWDEFISNDVAWNRSLSETDRDALLRHVGLLDLFRLSREVRLPLPETLEEPGPVPPVPLDGLLAELRGMVAKAKSPPATVTTTLAAVERFQRDMALHKKESGELLAGKILDDSELDKPLPSEVFCPLPERQTDSKNIREMWELSFRPLRDWLSRAATRAAVEIAEAFRQFRIAQGVLTFDDQIALALELLETPDVAERVLQKPWRVILDEAQDTDPVQFQVLLRLAQKLDPSVGITDVNAGRALPGRFSMVGDFQQSIYGQRADIPTYRQHHQDLLASRQGAEAVFQVTFRCSRMVVDFVNGVFPYAFAEDEKAAGSAGTSAAAAALGEQARFVKLQPASTAAEGRAFRVPLPPLPEDEDGDDGAGDSAWGMPGAAPSKRKRRRQSREIETHIAEHVAHVMAKEGLTGLQASRWSEVAVLCPRIAWLHPLRKALAARGIDSQNLSTHDIVGDHPARAWFTALAWIMAEPLSGYEIVGVLRDIFGISDDALAVFSDGDGARFQIARPVEVLAHYADDEPPARVAATASVSSGKAQRHTVPAQAAPPTTARTVAQTLRFLAGLREEMSSMAVRTAAQHLATATRLLERTELLPDVSDWPPNSMQEELETLLILAAHAEAAGTTFRAFAHSLRTGFSAPRPDTRMKPEAVQLITSYKAKGLEWDAVVIPFLHREIPIRARQHPRFLQLSPGKNPRVIFSSQDNSEPDRAAVDRLRDMEFERLLYVMCTRARRTLMLADDTACWPEPKKQYSKGGSSARTFTKCFKLRKSEEVQRVWNALPVVESTLEKEDGGADLSPPSPSSSAPALGSGSAAAASVESSSTAATASVAKKYESPSALPLFVHVREKWEKRRALVVQTADRFPRRVTPHSLAKTEEKLGSLPGQGHTTPFANQNVPEKAASVALAGPAPGDPETAPEPEDARPLNADRPGGTEYGTWWHALMESLPWSGPGATQEARRSAFEAALYLCQLPDRARREFALLEGSTLPGILSAPGLILHTELPFLLPGAEGEEDPNCLEGIIDMAWFDASTDAWTVLDWKTNFISAHQTEELKLMYAPQLQAYARALSELTHKPARAFVYATTQGQLMDVSG